jgi:hypothetical protein
MADQLEKFDFRGKGNRKYPWAKWSNGDIWQVAPEQDFDCGTNSFAAACYQHARRIGRKVRVDVSGVVTFQFYSESEDENDDLDLLKEVPVTDPVGDGGRES